MPACSTQGTAHVAGLHNVLNFPQVALSTEVALEQFLRKNGLPFK
jgi:hypothetical protein